MSSEMKISASRLVDASLAAREKTLSTLAEEGRGEGEDRQFVPISGDIAIRINNLSKCYQIYDAPHDRLKQFILPRMRRLAARPPMQYFREFWALKNVSFEVRKGETVGIVGRNGAGKSTLLQMISGVLTPTSGTIHTSGRIMALLELGAGLNPEFSGVENIQMSAVVLGMSDSELDRKIDKIIEFAALGEFIHQPVKYYSSGMVMRLAFAVAINFDPDVLIIDEALAVGDELFQLKCIRRIQEIKESGATILFVSHSTHTINQICDRAVLIDGGRAIFMGEAKAVSERYNMLLFSLEAKQVVCAPKTEDCKVLHDIKDNIGEDVLGSAAGGLFRSKDMTDEVRPQGYIIDVGVAGHDYRNLCFEQGEVVRFQMRVCFNADTHDVIMGMMITTATGVDCYHTNLLCRDLMIAHCAIGQTYVVTFEIPLNLNAGNYIVVFDCQYDLRAEPKLVDIFYEALKFAIPPNRLIDDGGVAALHAKIEYQLIQ